MNTLTWTDALALEVPVMDHTHQEFVELLARVHAADDATLPAAWNELLAHTEDHFGQEDAWMRDSGFASNNCHSAQHEVVLRVMREAISRQPPQPAWLRQLADELANWFPAHAQSMDAALALHLRSAGMDLDTGELPATLPQPTQLISGCGGAACSPEPVAAPG